MLIEARNHSPTYAAFNTAFSLTSIKLLPEQQGRMSKPEHSPGEFALAPGYYEQVNFFGQPTGICTSVKYGQPLPHAPIGHRWRLHLRAESGMSLLEVSTKIGVAEAAIAGERSNS